jgi:hypothetical protein
MIITSARAGWLTRTGVAAALAAGLTAGTAGTAAPAATSAQAPFRPAASHTLRITTPGRGSATATGPLGRQDASFAYYPPQEELVLFGGNNTSTVFGDTWIRRGTSWFEQHPSRSPSARTGAAVAFDAASNQLMLFGGSSKPGSGFDNETWVWTGHSWQQLHPATSPPARASADLIYDPEMQQMLLFGGYDGSYLNDTWTWNGFNWVQLHPATSPSPRDGAALVLNSASLADVLLYGGFSVKTGHLADTWSWDGTTWTQLHPATSPGRTSIAWQAADDTSQNQVLLFGGVPNHGPIRNSTWTWTGTTWAPLTPASSPPGRAGGSMTYNTLSRQISLFGGFTNPAGTHYPTTTWKWNGSTWSNAH